MGFGTIFAQIIFFTLVLVALVGFFSISKAISVQTKETLNIKEKIVTQKLNSKMQISSMVYNDTIPMLSIKVNNTGSTRMKLNYIDIYIDGSRIPRNQTNRSIVVLPPDIINPTMWDPDESIEINITALVPAGDHYISVMNEYSLSDSNIINIA